MKKLLVAAVFAVVAVCAGFVSYTAHAKNKTAELNLIMTNVESLSSGDMDLLEACDFYCQYHPYNKCELKTNYQFSIFCEKTTLRK